MTFFSVSHVTRWTYARNTATVIWHGLFWDYCESLFQKLQCVTDVGNFLSVLVPLGYMIKFVPVQCTGTASKPGITITRICICIG